MNACRTCSGTALSDTFTRRTLAIRPSLTLLRSRISPPSAGLKARISLELGQPANPQLRSHASSVTTDRSATPSAAHGQRRPSHCGGGVAGSRLSQVRRRLSRSLSRCLTSMAIEEEPSWVAPGWSRILGPRVLQLDGTLTALAGFWPRDPFAAVRLPAGRTAYLSAPEGVQIDLYPPARISVPISWSLADA